MLNLLQQSVALPIGAKSVKTGIFKTLRVPAILGAGSTLHRPVLRLYLLDYLTCGSMEQPKSYGLAKAKNANGI